MQSIFNFEKQVGSDTSQCCSRQWSHLNGRVRTNHFRVKELTTFSETVSTFSLKQSQQFHCIEKLTHFSKNKNEHFQWKKIKTFSNFIFSDRPKPKLKPIPKPKEGAYHDIFHFRLLLEAGVCSDEEFFPYCLSPIATASLYGYVSSLRRLLSSEKSSAVAKRVNLANGESEWTPMMLAAAVGSKPAAQFLLERGADPNHQNRS